jgi:8-oxo-dGTP diphosphatase
MIHKNKPENFNPDFEVSGCFCEYDGKILFIKRSASRSYAGKWGMPGGKLEKNETPGEAMDREFFEETGIIAGKFKKEFVKSFFVSQNGNDMIYHLFILKLKELIEDIVTEDGEEIIWEDVKKVKNLDLVEDVPEVFDLAYLEL